MIKCYAIEGQVFIRAKPSLPDVLTHKCSNENRSDRFPRQPAAGPSHSGAAPVQGNPEGEIAFHTLTNMPCVAAESVNTAVVKDAMTVEAAQRCAAVIREATGLSLFGFDLTVPSSWGSFLLVDVNAFPSFKGITGASDALRLFLQRQCKR